MPVRYIDQSKVNIFFYHRIKSRYFITSSSLLIMWLCNIMYYTL